jgi:outer membrane protein TolC
MRSSLSNVKQAYEASLNQAEAGQETLKSLLYLERNVRIKTEGYFHYQPLEVAYDEAFLKAMHTRPEIRQYEAEARLAQKDIAAAKADSRPDIYASWDYYSRSHASASTQRGWNDYNLLGITLSWPVFDGWLTKAKVEQAIIDLKQAQLLKEKNAQDIALEVKTAYLELKDAIAKSKSVADTLNVYQDNLAVFAAKYKTGLVSALDLEDAALSHNIALFNQNQAVFDYLIAQAKFDKATGGPL